MDHARGTPRMTAHGVEHRPAASTHPTPNAPLRLRFGNEGFGAGMIGPAPFIAGMRWVLCAIIPPVIITPAIISFPQRVDIPSVLE